MKPQWASRDVATGRPDTGPNARTRALVNFRAGGRCESCGTPIGRAQVHHRRPRGMGGTSNERLNRLSNLVYLCASCHAVVESLRADARTAGFLVANGADPADVPVLLWDGRRVLLTDGGDYIVEGGSE